MKEIPGGVRDTDYLRPISNTYMIHPQPRSPIIPIPGNLHKRVTVSVIYFYNLCSLFGRTK